MSDEWLIRLTPQEAAAALMLVTLGTDAYEGKEPDVEAIDNLNRIPGMHLRSLHRKLEAVAEKMDTQKNGL
jgi:hypothetical protein